MFIFLLSFLTIPALADEYPVEWSLGEAGFTNCATVFIYNKKMDCGERYAEILNCDRLKDKKRVRVLALGAVISDVEDECSPTIGFYRFVEVSGKSD